MRKQFDTMRIVENNSDVPVPPTYWCEPDGGPIGAPFFVMQRVEGIVPPDVPPYPFTGWILESSADDLRRMQDRTVEVLAKLHAIDADLSLLESVNPGDTPLRRHVADLRDFYAWVVEQGGRRSPLIDRSFDWVEAHWPASDQGQAVLSWGDSRIGNVMYRDYTPVAVLDWEMAATAPREVDVAWMITIHRFFQDLAEKVGMAGIPGFQRREDIEAEYERLTGYACQDLDWHTAYAALRYAVVMFRIGSRAQLFGEMPMDADPEDMILHKEMLAAMLDGTYWANVN
jgi:aminoglycoside phosphotransferase (APT) family kinase protein